MERLQAGLDLRTAVQALDSFAEKNADTLHDAGIYRELLRLVGQVEKFSDEVTNLAEDWRDASYAVVEGVNDLRTSIEAAEMDAWKRDAGDAERAALDDLGVEAAGIVSDFENNAPAVRPAAAA